MVSRTVDTLKRAAVEYGWQYTPIHAVSPLTPFTTAALLTRRSTAIALWFGPRGTITRAWVGRRQEVRLGIQNGPGHTRHDLAGGSAAVVARMRGGDFRPERTLR